MVVIGAVTFTLVVKGILLFKVVVNSVTLADVTTEDSVDVVVVFSPAAVLCGAVVTVLRNTVLTT